MRLGLALRPGFCWVQLQAFLPHITKEACHIPGSGRVSNHLGKQLGVRSPEQPWYPSLSPSEKE